MADVISNGDIFDNDCSSLSGWVDNDQGDAVSSQVTFDSESTFKFDAMTANAANYAQRDINVGAVPSEFVLSIKLYHDLLGTIGNTDYFRSHIGNSGSILRIIFASDGLFIYDGSSWNEVGTNLVIQDTWQTWTFIVDTTTPASAVCDVYLDGVLKASSVDCSWVVVSNGGFLLQGFGNTITNTTTYVDWIKVGSDLYVPGFAYSQGFIIS